MTGFWFSSCGLNADGKATLTAISRDGQALKYISIDLQTPQVCRAAVKDDPCAIRYVMAENLTDELQELARF